MHRDASKEMEGVPPQEVLVCGDDAHDRGLFECCGFPVSIAHAIPEARARAAVIAAATDDDRVTRALEPCVLTG